MHSHGGLYSRLHSRVLSSGRVAGGPPDRESYQTGRVASPLKGSGDPLEGALSYTAFLHRRGARGLEGEARAQSTRWCVVARLHCSTYRYRAHLAPR